MARMGGPAGVPSIGAAQTLHIWEQAEGLSPVGRALALAEIAAPSVGDLATQPLGRTHTLLLRLQAAAFGPAMEATARCPGCSSQVEFQLDVEALLALGSVEPHESYDVAVGDLAVTWRPLTPADLLAVGEDPEPARALLRRSVWVVEGDTDPITLPSEVVDAVEVAMVAADPLAEVLVSVACPECAVAFDADVDLASFVWAEIGARAKRVLHEVDVLARAYGWTEPEVLALSESRRAAYIRLVQEGAP